jgi:O-antigen/teichoic acid export membrane protein
MLLTMGQGLLVAFGYAVHLVGTRVLSQADYGRFMTALSFSNWLHVALAALIVPGICKIVSENHRRLRVALATAVWWHWGVSLLLCVILLLGAGQLARLFGDAALTPLFLVTAVEILFFAGFALGIRLLGALRHFIGASVTMASYSLVRALGAVALLLAGVGAVGATLGLAAGSVVGGLVGMTLVMGLRRRIAPEPYPPMLRRSMLWAMMTLPASVGVVTLTTMDIWFVKALMADPTVAGLYGAAFATSRLPAVLVQGLLGATFPRVSHALAEGRKEIARDVATKAMRFVMVVFAPVCVVTAATSRGIMTLLFGANYGEAHLLLTLLVLALCLSSMLKLMLELLAAADHPGRRLAFVAGLLPIAVALNILLIRRMGAPGAAFASLITMAAATLIGGMLVYRTLGALPPAVTALRCAVSAGIVYALGVMWEAEGIMVIVKVAVLSAVYLALLFATRELHGKDMRNIRRNIPGFAARSESGPARLGGE